MAKDAGGHIENARAFLAEGNLDAALAAYTQALEEDPDAVVAHYGMAKVSALMGDTARAIEMYRAAIKREPCCEGVTGLGELLLDLGQPDEAGELFREALRLDADAPLAYVFLAELASRRGDYDEAAELLRKGVRRGAELPALHVVHFYQQWVQSLVGLGEVDRAGEVSMQGAEFFGDVHVLLMSARLADGAGARAIAVTRYKRALKSLPPGTMRTEVLERIAELAE